MPERRGGRDGVGVDREGGDCWVGEPLMGHGCLGTSPTNIRSVRSTPSLTIARFTHYSPFGLAIRSLTQLRINKTTIKNRFSNKPFVRYAHSFPLTNSSAKSNEKPSVIQTRRQELTTDGGLDGMLAVWVGQ